MDVQIDYLCICDGAFFDRDSEIATVNPLQINLPAGITTIKAKKDNFFQTFGHELLRGQGKVGPSGFPPGVEFHGPLNSFNNDDLEKTGANTQAKIAEIRKNMAKPTFIDTPAKRIAAGNQLHVAAVDDGEQKRDLVIKMLLIKP